MLGLNFRLGKRFVIVDPETGKELATVEFSELRGNCATLAIKSDMSKARVYRGVVWDSILRERRQKDREATMLRIKRPIAGNNLLQVIYESSETTP